MRSVKLIHPSFAREVTSPQDAERLQKQGWVELSKAKAVSDKARWQRRFRQRQQEAGRRELSVWLPEETYRALCLAKKPGESTAELLERLIKISKLL